MVFIADGYQYKSCEISLVFKPTSANVHLGCYDKRVDALDSPQLGLAVSWTDLDDIEL